jgi:hypothetical protein
VDEVEAAGALAEEGTCRHLTNCTSMYRTFNDFINRVLCVFVRGCQERIDVAGLPHLHRVELVQSDVPVTTTSGSLAAVTSF